MSFLYQSGSCEERLEETRSVAAQNSDNDYNSDHNSHDSSDEDGSREHSVLGKPTVLNFEENQSIIKFDPNKRLRIPRPNRKCFSLNKITILYLVIRHSYFNNISGKIQTTPMRGRKGRPIRNKNISKALILNVQSHPAIWDQSSKDYKDIILKLDSWNKILANLRSSFSSKELKNNKMANLQEVKDRWKNLRTVFIKKKKRAESQSSSGNFFAILILI